MWKQGRVHPQKRPRTSGPVRSGWRRKLRVIERLKELAKSETPPREALKILDESGIRINVEFAWKLLEEVDLFADSFPRAARYLGRVGVAVAKSAALEHEPCVLSRAYGSLGIAVLAQSDLKRAEIFIDIAMRFADGCDMCTADVLLRRAHLRWLQDRRDGLVDLKVAENIFQRCNHPRGIGQARNFRAAFRYYLLGDTAGALEDLAFALSVLKSETNYRRAILHNMTVMLASSGRLADFLKLLGLIPGIRLSLKGVDGASLERKKIRWIIAMVLPWIHQADRARDMLLTLFGEFKAERLADECVALIADLISIDRHSVEKIEAHLERVKALPFVREKQYLMDAIREFELAIDVVRLEDEELAGAIRNLRGAATMKSRWLPECIIDVSAAPAKRTSS